MANIYRFNLGPRPRVRNALADLIATLPKIKDDDKLEEVFVGCLVRAFPSVRKGNIKHFMVLESRGEDLHEQIVRSPQIAGKGFYTKKTISVKQRVFLDRYMTRHEKILFFYDRSGRGRARHMIICTNQRVMSITDGYCTCIIEKHAIGRVARKGFIPNFALEIIEGEEPRTQAVPVLAKTESPPVDPPEIEVPPSPENLERVNVFTDRLNALLKDTVIESRPHVFGTGENASRFFKRMRVGMSLTRREGLLFSGNDGGLYISLDDVEFYSCRKLKQTVFFHIRYFFEGIPEDILIRVPVSQAGNLAGLISVLRREKSLCMAMRGRLNSLAPVDAVSEPETYIIARDDAARELSFHRYFPDLEGRFLAEEKKTITYDDVRGVTVTHEGHRLRIQIDAQKHHRYGGHMALSHFRTEDVNVFFRTLSDNVTVVDNHEN